MALAPATPARWNASRAGLRLVLVDDDAAVREALSGLLEDAGFTVAGTAANGPDGLALVQLLQPDVAVVDFKMPGMTGLEVASEIRARRPRTAVIILSAYDDEGLQSAARGVVAAYLVKGCPASRIIAKIDEVGRATG